MIMNASMLRILWTTVILPFVLAFHCSSSRIPYAAALLQVRPLGGGRVVTYYSSSSSSSNSMGFQQLQEEPRRRQTTSLSKDQLGYKKWQSLSPLFVVPENLALVVGQETYGFGLVVLGEAIYSFAQAPSLDQVKVLLPGILGAVRSNDYNIISSYLVYH